MNVMPTNSTVRFILVSIVAALVVLTGALIYKGYFQRVVPSSIQKTIQPTSAPGIKAQSSLITDCTPPEVSASTLAFISKDASVYGLRGRILSINDIASGKRLITNIEGKIPGFAIASSTKVLFVNGKEESVGSADDVKVGQRVVISIHCSAKNNWATSVVRIVE